MANALFRWTLTNLSDNTTDVLTKDPIGWEAIIARIERNKIYHGVTQSVSTPIKFHCEGGGKQFIEAAYLAEDIDAIVEILIEYRCDPLSNTYADLYVGKLDFTTIVISDSFVEMNIERGGFAAKLQAREETPIDVETAISVGGVALTAPTVNTMTLECQQLYLQVGSETTNTITHTDTGTADSFHLWRGFARPSMPEKSTEIDSYPGFSEYADFAQDGPIGNNTNLPHIFEALDLNIQYPATFTYTFSFDGTFYDDILSSVSRSNFAHAFSIAWGPSLGVALDLGQVTTLFTSGGYTETGTNFTEAFSNAGTTANITLNFGDRVWLYWYEDVHWNAGPYGNDYSFTYEYDNFSFAMEIYSNFDSSFCKTSLVHEALCQTVDAIVDQDDSVYSEFYGRKDSAKRTYAANGCGAFLAITDGLNIRAFPDKPIHNSLKGLFEALHALHNIGLGIEADPADATRDIVRVERITHFYDSTTTLLTLPNVSDVRTRIDSSRYITNVNIGYNKWETNYRGGLDEPCAKHEYSTLVNAVKGIYTKLCAYVSSGYALEFTRRKQHANRPTEDSPYDNDNFFIAVNKSVDGSGIPTDLAFAEKRPDGFTTASGSVADIDKMFNLRLTPARMLLAHFNRIVSGLQIIQGVIKLVKGEGNTGISAETIGTTCPEEYSGAGLSENLDFDFDEANVNDSSPLTSTEIYSFKYPLTYAQFVLVRANPYGLIAFTDYTGTTKSGFILNMEFELKTGITSFELIKA